MCAIQNPRFDKRGSLWHKWDLHFHTPSSIEYENKAVTNEEIIDTLVNNQIDVVAITDHHKMDIERIKALQKISGEKVTILPGIEFRDHHGSKPIHYISIFPEDCDLEHVWTTIEGKLGLTSKAVKEKGGDEKIYVKIEEGAKETFELGGVVSIHAGAKSNSIENIKNSELFQQRIKYDITNEYVDLLEIGQLKDIDTYLKIVFPSTGLEKPLIICSDCHNINDYSVKAQLWMRADPTFRGLLMVLREPQDRVYIGDRPPQLKRVEQNPTKYIDRVSIKYKEEAPKHERWFDNEILLNPGLVAIVGNKGSGKSALSDTIGLLGATKNNDSFSFLSKDRFCHPTAGHANHYEAVIDWVAGEEVPCCLADRINIEEVERVKYLPQNYVEKICNELMELEERGFEKELGVVIFSHVPEPKRLGCNKLSELIDFKNGEKQKRIDSLIKQLKEVSRSRANLEEENDPVNKKSIKKQIKQKEQELNAHERNKPEEVPNPVEADSKIEKDSGILDELKKLQEKKGEIAEKIEGASKKLGEAERNMAVAMRLDEMLSNFMKDFGAFNISLEKEASKVGLKAKDLISVSVELSGIEKLKIETNIIITVNRTILEDKSDEGIKKQLSSVEAEINETQARLDAPNRAYQAYVEKLDEWKKKRKEIIGSNEDEESLKGLNYKLLELDLLPKKIEEQMKKQIKIAVEIHKGKMEQVAVYKDLYGPVQEFIDTHELSTEQLKMEFHAELTEVGFNSGLLNLLALNRKGSFMGIDEGRAKVEEFIQKTIWNDEVSVKEFLGDIDKALHEDQREKPAIAKQLKDQILKGVQPEQVFNFLYGLEYVRSKYVLRWEGKDLEMLSPGERGTLLLVFYLLIEKGNTPLIIDQPEGNLDNLTIAQVLVDCIKTARNQRQVFIVTHNPNLAVVCDADQVIYAEMKKNGGTKVTYKTGSLENPIISSHVSDVLEGTRRAFGVRGGKYKAAQDKK
ncbi:TrlF family AAA-like ATPase [Chloroflexota bacterium]